MAAEQTEDFADAFARLADVDGDAPPPPPAEPKTEPKVEPEAKDEPAPTAAAESEPSTTEEPVAEAPADEPADEPADDEASDDVAALLRRIAQESRKLAREEAPAPEPEATPAPTPAPEAELYTAEEKNLLKSYETDWPDVAKAEALRRRAEYHDLVKYVFAEVAKELSPMAEMVRAMAQQQHHSELTSVVSDYDDVRDKVVDWVKQQPAYLQPAYTHVIEQGTVEEVADLIQRYRQSTAPAPSAAPKPTAVKKEPELPTATKQAAAALAPVSSKRSAVTQVSDPGDFEAAFENFAKM